MPFVHVRALPDDRPDDLDAVLAGLCDDLAAATGVAREHFTATWAEVAGVSGTHVLADVLLPDLHPPERIEALLLALAASLEARAGIAPARVFADVQLSRSGRVLDGGEIVRWD